MTTGTHRTVGQLPADPSGRGWSYVFATSDAALTDKFQVDEVLPGVNDYIRIQAVLNSLSDFQSLLIVGNNVNLGATGISINHSYFTFHSNAILNYSGTGTAVSIANAGTNPITSNVQKFYNDIWLTIVATGAAITNATVGFYNRGLMFSNCHLNIRGFDDGVCMQIDPASAGNIFTESNEWWLNLEGKTGITFTGGASSGNNLVRFFAYNNYGSNASNAIDTSGSGSYYANNWVFVESQTWPSNGQAFSVLNGYYHASFKFIHLSVDAGGGSEPTITVFNNANVPTDVVDKLEIVGLGITGLSSPKIWSTGNSYPAVSMFNLDGRLLWGNPAWLNVPIIYLDQFMTGTIQNGTGSYGLRANGVDLQTGLTINSYIDLTPRIWSVATGQNFTNYAKDFKITFYTYMTGEDTNFLGVFAWKDSPTRTTDLNAIGVEIKFTWNGATYTVTGETQGAGGYTTVSLGSIGEWENHRWDIVKTSGQVAGIQFLKDLQWIASIETATKFPNTNTGSEGVPHFYLANGNPGKNDEIFFENFQFLYQP